MFSLSSGGLWALIAVDLALDYLCSAGDDWWRVTAHVNVIVDWVESLWNHKVCDAT